MLPGLVSCRSLFKRKLYHVSTSVSVCAQLFHQTNLLWPVSCCRCGIHHGPPSMDLFLLTSDHYPRIESRNHLSTQELACLNGKFLCLCPWVNIIGPWMKDSASVRLQVIYSHLTDCTWTSWKSLTSMMIFLALVNGIHQWPVIKWIIPCSTSSPSFTWLRVMSFGMGNWRPWDVILCYF